MKYVLNTDRCCLVWHGHHEAQSPIEILPESFDSRMKTIETVKAKEETPEQITRRKQLFRLVIGPLPPAWQKAYAEWRKAYAEWQEAYAVWRKAHAEWRKADAALRKADAVREKADAVREEAYAAWQKAYAAFISSHYAEIMALHAKQCGCGWTPTNRNIFKYKDEAKP